MDVIADFLLYVSGYNALVPWLKKKKWLKNKSPLFLKVVAIFTLILIPILLWLIISPIWFYGERLLNM